MSKFVLIALVVVFSTLCYGRHIHLDPAVTMESEPEIDEMTIEKLLLLRQNHLVPINHALFFRRYGPCAEGLQRDIFGACREVWD